MKLFHLSDLHLGKRLNEYSLLEDQRYILEQILSQVQVERPDGILLAGDIYDKPIPSAEAVELFDWFLNRLSARSIPVFIISGNHDSPERLSFGGRLMAGSGVYLSPVYSGEISPITLTDEYGPADIWLLPFIKPAHVRRFFPEEEIGSYTDALRTAISQLKLDPCRRNILVTHQFVTGASRSDSEEISVGGTDNVEAEVFASFDYVALGHIHSPQNVTRSTLRYCGTPLKYSFSEVDQEKSITVVTLKEKDEVNVDTLPLLPLRELRELRGTYDSLTRLNFYQNTTYPQDYLHITLTDEEDVPDALAKLRVIYPNIMKLDYDNQRTRHMAQITGEEEIEQKSPLKLFEEFYSLQNNQPVSQEQRELLTKLIDELWEVEQ